MRRKVYHPRKQSRGPWAKRENSEYEFGGGADSILDAAKWIKLRREGQESHARMMATDPMYAAMYKMREEWSRLAFEGLSRDILTCGKVGPFDGGGFLPEVLIYPTYGSEPRNGPLR